MVPTQGGSVLYVCTKFEADSSFRSYFITGSQISPRRPPYRGRGTAKIQSAGDGHYLYLQTQFGEDRCIQFRFIVLVYPQTHTHTRARARAHTHTQTGQITIQCAAASLARSVATTATTSMADVDDDARRQRRSTTTTTTDDDNQARGNEK